MNYAKGIDSNRHLNHHHGHIDHNQRKGSIMTMITIQGKRYIPSEWVEELRKEMNFERVETGLPEGYSTTIMNMVNQANARKIER